MRLKSSKDLLCCRDVCSTSTPPPLTAGVRLDDGDDDDDDVTPTNCDEDDDVTPLPPTPPMCMLAYIALCRCGVMLSSLIICDSSASLFGMLAVSGTDSDA